MNLEVSVFPVCSNLGIEREREKERGEVGIANPIPGFLFVTGLMQRLSESDHDVVYF